MNITTSQSRRPGATNKYQAQSMKCECGHNEQAHVEDGSCFFEYNCGCKKYEPAVLPNILEANLCCIVNTRYWCIVCNWKACYDHSSDYSHQLFDLHKFASPDCNSRKILNTPFPHYVRTFTK